jgi:hypothetical protein
MKTLPEVHLCIVQPAGYVPSVGLLDPARYFRFQFRRLGAQVTLGKNRLRHDAVNFVFGAHLGFDPTHCQRHSCIFVNLQQLSKGGQTAPLNYLKLLGANAVVDCDQRNVPLYATHPEDVPVVPVLYAPYLTPDAPIPLEERPIDLLFFGQINDRRRAWLDRIEATGQTVATFDEALYGPERDLYIAQAKTVLNAHTDDDGHFEQLRVAHCLSLGTPVISERTAHMPADTPFEHCVLWLEGQELEQFFTQDFGTPAYFDAMRAALEQFQAADPLDAYADLLAFATGYADADRERRDSMPWHPKRINLAAGARYLPGWLNLDPDANQLPDVQLDLSAPLDLPIRLESPYVGSVVLEPASVETIDAHACLTTVASLPALMDNCLRLLRTGGALQLEVPYAEASTAWQNSQTVRALNENSWSSFTGAFWNQGWLEHRFDIISSQWLDAQRRPSDRVQAAYMRLVLAKVETTPYERTVARTLRADFGGIEEDALVVSGEPPMQAPMGPTVPGMPSAASATPADFLPAALRRLASTLPC